MFQFERKNNKQRKKILLFNPLPSNVDVISHLRNVNNLMTMGTCFILDGCMSLLAAQDVKMKCNNAGSSL